MAPSFECTFRSQDELTEVREFVAFCSHGQTPNENVQAQRVSIWVVRRMVREVSSNFGLFNLVLTVGVCLRVVAGATQCTYRLHATEYNDKW